MTFRKEADYASIYDEESTEIALQYAAAIFEKVKTLIEPKKEVEKR